MNALLFWYRFWQKMRIFFPWFLFISTILLLSLFATRVFWQGGFPYTHDGENHLARFANYLAAVREGQFPPRFAPHLFAGYGFPVFHYNYPLANIFALPLLVLRLNPEVVYSFQALAATFVVASSWYFFLRRRFSAASTWIGVLAIILSSALQSNFFFRGNIGEIWALAFSSLFFAIWERRKRFGSFSIPIMVFILSSFLLSHNVLAVFFSPWLILWQIFQVKNRQDYREIIFIWLLSLGIVSWFWIPAIGELTLIILQQDSLAQEASQHVLRINQILWSPLRFGFSRSGGLDNLGWGLGFPILVMLFLGIGQVVRFRFSQYKDQRKNFLYFFFLFVASLFLTSNLSTFLWKSVPVLPLMQFPWRWLTLQALSLPFLMAFVFEMSEKWGKRALLLSLFLWVLVLSGINPADRFHRDSLWYRNFPHTTLTRNENRPKTLSSDQLPNWELGPKFLIGEAKDLEISTWSGSSRSYSFLPVTDVLVQEPTVYFPGWQTRADGEFVEQVFLDETQGLIAYRVPAGERVSIKSGFFERTPLRLFSEVTAIITFLGVLGMTLYSVVQRKKQ